MTFREIDNLHPYFVSLAEAKVEKPPAYEHFYCPTNSNWPVYGIILARFNNGFHISAAVKTGLDAWWKSCHMYNPIPHELAQVIKDWL